MGNLTICDLDAPSTIQAKAILSLIEPPPRMTVQTWRKLVDAWACSYGPDMAHVTDGGRFVEQVSQKRVEETAAEMRKRQAIPYGGQWYAIELTD